MIPDILWDEISKLILKKENNIGRPRMCLRKTLYKLFVFAVNERNNFSKGVCFGNDYTSKQSCNGNGDDVVSSYRIMI